MHKNDSAMKNRVFTDEELQELSESGLERTRREIISGDTQAALSALDELYESLAFLHDCQACWISALLTHIYEKYGVDRI